MSPARALGVIIGFDDRNLVVLTEAK